MSIDKPDAQLYNKICTEEIAFDGTKKDIRNYLVQSINSISRYKEVFKYFNEIVVESYSSLNALKKDLETITASLSIPKNISNTLINSFVQIRLTNNCYEILSLNLFSEPKKLILKILPGQSILDLTILKDFEQITIIDSEFINELVIPAGIKKLILSDSHIPLINTTFNSTVEIINYDYYSEIF